jgi:signal transduction histidine kinase
MPDRLTRIARLAGRWFDPFAAVVSGAVCSGELAATPLRSAGLTVALTALSALGCAGLLLRRRHPLAVAVVFGVASFVPGAVIGARWWNAQPEVLLLVNVILIYTTGECLPGARSLVGLVTLALGGTGGQLPGDVVPIFVFTIPPWVAGTVMRSRDEIARQLAARADELDREREAYAREAVRYERSRIARDLHDIVAHNLSAIVVQAGAGRRALDSDPATAAESLRHIEGSAGQAKLEIASLVDLLAADNPRAGDGGGLGMVDELIRRSVAAGLAVTYRFSANLDHLPAALADAAYHVAQEGITNALKHAPGAPIIVDVNATTTALSITVENGAHDAESSGVEHAGGGYGLAGLRDRVASAGGTLHADPTPIGGWRTTAVIPRPARGTRS